MGTMFSKYKLGVFGFGFGFVVHLELTCANCVGVGFELYCFKRWLIPLHLS
jgi:hypothetical protein